MKVNIKITNIKITLILLKSKSIILDISMTYFKSSIELKNLYYDKLLSEI